MRTTVTLDSDLAELLTREVERTGRPFHDVVNDAIRRGLVSSADSRPGIEVPVFDLGSAADEGPWDVLADQDASYLASLDPSLKS